MQTFKKCTLVHVLYMIYIAGMSTIFYQKNDAGIFFFLNGVLKVILISGGGGEEKNLLDYVGGGKETYAAEGTGKGD